MSKTLNIISVSKIQHYMKQIVVEQRQMAGHTPTHTDLLEPCLLREIHWVTSCVPHCPSLTGVTQRDLIGLGTGHWEEGLLRCMKSTTPSLSMIRSWSSCLSVWCSLAVNRRIPACLSRPLRSESWGQAWWLKLYSATHFQTWLSYSSQHLVLIKQCERIGFIPKMQGWFYILKMCWFPRCNHLADCLPPATGLGQIVLIAVIVIEMKPLFV